jgi:hypothetical protein
VPGGWGQRGSTQVLLAAADRAVVKAALEAAWQNIAAKTPRRRESRRTGTTRTPATTAGDLVSAFARVRKAVRAAKLPEVKKGVSFGTPALKVRGKFLMRIKDPETLVFRCPVDEKAMLMEAVPDIYFETDHYKGYPAVLVRLSRISDAELQHCLERAWRFQAPAQLVTPRAARYPP